MDYHDTLDGIDFIFSDERYGDYDFIIYDCGELPVQAIAVAVPDEMKTYCSDLLGDIDALYGMFSYTV